MNSIYCLVFTGDAITDELRTFLFSAAQDLMRNNSRKKRVSDPATGLNGFITTSYRLAMLGSVCGFTFTAEMDWKGGEIKADFIVRPLSQKFLDTRMKDLRWRAVNADFLPEPEPWRN